MVLCTVCMVSAVEVTEIEDLSVCPWGSLQEFEEYVNGNGDSLPETTFAIGITILENQSLDGTDIPPVNATDFAPGGELKSGSTIGEEPPLCADFVPVSMTIEPSVSDLDIELSYTVENQGTAPTSGESLLYDSVFLSTDPVYDVSDTQISISGDGVTTFYSIPYYTHRDTLLVGESYTAHLTAYIPRIQPGQYYLIVWVKHRYNYFGPGEGELSEENNFISRPFTMQELELIVQKSGDAPDTEWRKTEGAAASNEGIRIIRETLDGSLIAGMTRDDVFHLARFNHSGELEWDRTFEGFGYGGANFIRETGDGGFILTGSRNSDLSLIRTDREGTMLWEKSYGDPEVSEGGSSLDITSDGGYILVGNVGSAVWLIRTDAEGNQLWDQNFTVIGDPYHSGDSGHAVVQTADGGYAVLATQYYYYYGPWSGLWLIRTDSEGNQLWERTYGGELCNSGTLLHRERDGSLLMLGSTWRPYGQYRSFLCSLDAEGDVIWSTSQGSRSTNFWNDLQPMPDGGYVFAGSTASDLWLTRLREDGGEKWSIILGTAYCSEGAQSLTSMRDGGFLAAGSTDSYGAGGSDAWLLKYPGYRDAMFGGGAVHWAGFSGDLQTYSGTGDAITVLGALNGTAEIQANAVILQNSPFAGRGFFNGTYYLVLNEGEYWGTLQGMIIPDPETGKWLWKGSLSGNVSSIFEAELPPGVSGDLEGTLRTARLGTQQLSLTLEMSGTVDVVEGPSYSGITLQGFQEPLNGSVYYPGQTSSAFDAMLTGILIDDPTIPVHGRGMAVLNYRSSGEEGVAFLSAERTGYHRYNLEGSFPASCEGIVSGQFAPSAERLACSRERIRGSGTPQADLKLQVWGPEGVSPGQSVVYVAEVRNEGTAAAEDESIIIRVPLNATLVEVGPGGEYDREFGEVRFDLGSVPPRHRVQRHVVIAPKWGLTADQKIQPVAIVPRYKIQEDPSAGVQWTTTQESSDHVSMTGTVSSSSGSKQAQVEITRRSSSTKSEPSLTVSEDGEHVVMKQSFSAGEENGEGSGGEGSYEEFDITTCIPKGLNDCLDNGVSVYRTIKKAVQAYKTEENFIAKMKEKGFTDFAENHKNDPELRVGGELTQEALSLFASSKRLVGQVYELIPEEWPGCRQIRERSLWDEIKMEAIDKGMTHIFVENNINSYEDFVAWIFREKKYPTGKGSSRITPAKDPNIKYGPNGVIMPGQTLHYQVEFENEGEGIAFGVYFTDTLDPALDECTLSIGPVINITGGEVIAPPGTYNPRTRTITWIVGEVGPGNGGYADFSVDARRYPLSGSPILNYATVYFPSVPEETRTNTIISKVYEIPVHNLTIWNGWNFISVPASLAPGYDTPLIFSGVDMDDHQVWSYDASSQVWISLANTSKILPLEGIWVYNDNPKPTQVPLVYANGPLAPPVKSLEKGWNAIGLGSKSGQSPSVALASLGDRWRLALVYENSLQMYMPPLFHGDESLLYPFQGYWIYMEEEGNLVGYS